MSAVHVLGVRHHGPGSARAVASALDEVRPDIVLIEGAPEIDAVLALAASDEMRPPVAALVYCPDEPRRASFYPLADFSPEWVALRWALAHDRPVQMVDLPAANMLAERAAAEADADPSEPTGDATGPDAQVLTAVRGDPIGVLAAAAGYTDPERWWEDAVEHRHRPSTPSTPGGDDDPDGPAPVRSTLDSFAAVAEAMATLRSEGVVPETDEDLRREAAMRKAIRAAIKVHDTVAVVCGAWHAPVLDPAGFPPATRDNALLKGLPKVKVTATWVPWTADRLSYRSGYGAGVSAPAWYRHLLRSPDHVTVRWMTRTAHLLRAQDLDASPASVVEASRLADALAALRGRPLAGLDEMTDASRAVLTAGSDVPLRVIAEDLYVGRDLGEVPDDTPSVPLARDLDAQQRRLRLKPKAGEATITLDLRNSSQRERSHLLHRLRIIGVGWGDPIDAGRTRGTFKEAWKLEWQPEMAVALVEASGRGNTIASAASATLAARAQAADIGELTTVVEVGLLADLPDAVSAAIALLEERSARQSDIARLMEAIGPLARLARYGDVRQVDTDLVSGVLGGLATRVAIGLGAACASLDDDAAAAMRGHIDAVQAGLALLDRADLREMWAASVARLSEQAGVHGAVTGRASRITLDSGGIDSVEAAARLSRRLSRGAEAAAGAAWLDGFLDGDASLLIHDPLLLPVIDEWVSTVGQDALDDLLPVLRRTFSRFEAPERKVIGRTVRRLDGSGGSAAGGDTVVALHEGRAERAMPLLRAILGAQP